MRAGERACEVCSKPLLDGQATYAGRRHWDCHQQKTRIDVEKLLSEITTLSEAKAYIRQLLTRVI